MVGILTILNTKAGPQMIGFHAVCAWYFVLMWQGNYVKNYFYLFQLCVLRNDLQVQRSEWYPSLSFEINLILHLQQNV